MAFSTLSSGVKIAAVVAVIGGLWWANQHFIVNPAVNAETARWQQKWAARDSVDAAAALAQEKTNRDKELSLQADADAAQEQADKDKAALSSRLAASRAASERLQQGISAAIDAINTGGTVAGATTGGKTGAATGVLLAELYRSINQRAADLAGEADRARSAGLVCEKLYDNARSSAQ